MTRPLRLLILSNDAEAATELSASLGTDGVVVYSTTDPDEACQLISLLQHDVLLIEIDKLIGIPVYTLQAFRQEKSDIKIVGISRGQRGDTGLLLGLGIARLIGSLFYGVSPVDPISIAATITLLGLAALLASYIPARRAAKIDPMEARRDE